MAFFVDLLKSSFFDSKIAASFLVATDDIDKASEKFSPDAIRIVFLFPLLLTFSATNLAVSYLSSPANLEIFSTLDESTLSTDFDID